MLHQENNGREKLAKIRKEKTKGLQSKCTQICQKFTTLDLPTTLPHEEIDY